MLDFQLQGPSFRLVTDLSIAAWRKRYGIESIFEIMERVCEVKEGRKDIVLNVQSTVTVVSGRRS